MTQKRTAPDWGKYTEANRRHWDEVVLTHVDSEFYDVASFRAGKTKLKPVELMELGQVRGKSLLHLQCHFGLDTLSWAREGAIVTGVDFSERAVEVARNLAAETEIDARFVVSDIYSLPRNLRGNFDIVFTSYGVLCWLPDISGWAEVMARFIKPGGTFYIVEFHPFAGVFDNAPEVADLNVRYPYFPTAEPLRSEGHGSYADPSAQIRHQVTYQWQHTLGDIVSALIDAGLLIEFMHEFPFSTYQFLPFTEKQPDGTVRLKKHDGCVPLLFSIKASKPAV
jgi:ubiquinone/menaquinone biosynthesis C-methylase UbiE